jgi:hypothetical protein
MGLENVNGVEPDFVVVLLGELIQGGNLPPKWRSGIAAEDQHYWSVSPKGGEIGRSVIFQFFDGKGRS